MVWTLLVLNVMQNSTAKKTKKTIIRYLKTIRIKRIIKYKNTNGQGKK